MYLFWEDKDRNIRMEMIGFEWKMGIRQKNDQTHSSTTPNTNEFRTFALKFFTIFHQPERFYLSVNEKGIV